MSAETETVEKPLSVPLNDVIGNVLDGVFADEPEPPKQPEPKKKEDVKEPHRKAEKQDEKPAKTEERAPKEKSKPEERDEGVVPLDLLSSTVEEGVGKGSDKTDSPKSEAPVLETLPKELEGKSKATKEHWERLAKSKFDAETRAYELAKKYAKAEEQIAKGDPDAKARVETLEKELAEYRGVIDLASLEFNPKFQRETLVPRKQWLDYGKKSLEDAGLDPKLLEAAVSSSGKTKAEKIDEILGEITSEFQKGKVRDAINNIERLDAKADYERANHKTYLENYQKEEAANRSKGFSEYEKITKANLEEAGKFLAEDKKIIFFKKSSDPKATDWNEKIDKCNEIAEMIMLKNDNPKELAIAAKMASFFPLVYSAYLKERELHLKERSRNRREDESEPGLGSGKPRDNGARKKSSDDPISRAIDSVFGD